MSPRPTLSIPLDCQQGSNELAGIRSVFFTRYCSRHSRRTSEQLRSVFLTNNEEISSARVALRRRLGVECSGGAGGGKVELGHSWVGGWVGS